MRPGGSRGPGLTPGKSGKEMVRVLLSGTDLSTPKVRDHTGEKEILVLPMHLSEKLS